MKKIELKFDDAKGEIFLENNSNVMLSRGQVAWLQREFEKVAGPATSVIMYKAARLYSQLAVSNIKKVMIKILGMISEEIVAKEMLKQLSIWGYGHGEFLELDFSIPYAKIKVTNSFNAIGYEKVDKPVCHFLRGIIAGASSIVTGREMHCLEIKCVAKGDEYCEFEVMTPEEEEKKRIPKAKGE
jgi:predicted hydrocarbon binding protein